MLLFMYLIAAEVGGDAEWTWHEFNNLPVSLLHNYKEGEK